jgi:hypothetical protein
MRRLLLLGILPLVLTVSCARGGASGSQMAPPRASGSTTAGESRDAKIYAAVLRRYLTTPGENSNLQFKTVFVFDYADTTAADPMRTAKSDKAAPISATDQLSITAALRDVAPVHFVASRNDAVTSNKDGCAVVRDNGILVLLGPPTAAADQIQVGINGFVACLGATWFTYVVTQNADRWVVTGRTGPAAIS